MPPRSPKIPSYRHQKSRDLAVVRIDGRDHYLGPYGSPESRALYDQLIAEWLGRGRASVPVDPEGHVTPDVTVAELILAYLNFAQDYYKKRGEGTSELGNIKVALRPLRRLYGAIPAAQFGPAKLKAVRAEMIAADLSRSEVNRRVGRVVRLFKWAAAEEMVSILVHQTLKAVPGIPKGRSAIRETEPVRPVDDAAIEAVRPHVAAEIWAMVQLQRLTGMRPGEVVILRTGDVDRSADDSWIYTPREHKTEHHGKSRTIYLGPRAIAVLTPWLKADPDAFLFSPKAAHQRRMAAMRAGRKSRVQPSQRDRSRPGAKRRPGLRYSVRSYYHAVARGCDLAFPHPTLGSPNPKELPPEQQEELRAWRQSRRWHPHQIRHTAATAIRKELGLDVARAVLGHSSPAVTEIYAERDGSAARRAMEKLG